MAQSDFKLTLLTDSSPETVFRAINNVREWWSGYHSESFVGDTKALNDVFSFHAGGGAHRSTQQIVESIPNRRVVWLIIESELSFLPQKDEWTGTKVIFDIAEIDGRTQLTFTHQGLNPEIACYDSCAPAWTQYLQNRLLPLINSAVAR